MPVGWLRGKRSQQSAAISGPASQHGKCSQQSAASSGAASQLTSQRQVTTSAQHEVASKPSSPGGDGSEGTRALLVENRRALIVDRRQELLKRQQSLANLKADLQQTGDDETSEAVVAKSFRAAAEGSMQHLRGAQPRSVLALAALQDEPDTPGANASEKHATFADVASGPTGLSADLMDRDLSFRSFKQAPFEQPSFKQPSFNNPSDRESPRAPAVRAAGSVGAATAPPYSLPVAVRQAEQANASAAAVERAAQARLASVSHAARTWLLRTQARAVLPVRSASRGLRSSLGVSSFRKAGEQRSPRKSSKGVSSFRKGVSSFRKGGPQPPRSACIDDGGRVASEAGHGRGGSSVLELARSNLDSASTSSAPTSLAPTSLASIASPSSRRSSSADHKRAAARGNGTSLCRMHAGVFEAAALALCSLDVSQLGWRDGEVCALAVALPRFRMCSKVRFGGCVLGVDG